MAGDRNGPELVDSRPAGRGAAGLVMERITGDTESSTVVPRRSIVSSDDPEDAYEQLTAGLGRSLFAAPIGRTFSFHTSILELGDFRFMTSPRPTTARMFGVAGRRAFSVGRLTAGSYRLEHDQNHWNFRPGESVVLPTRQEMGSDWHGHRAETVFLDVEATERAAAEILGLDSAMLDFSDPRPRHDAGARHWWQAVRHVTQTVVRSPVAFGSPMVRREAFRTLTVALLHNFAYDLSSDAAPRRDLTEPAVIRRAIGVIEARAADPDLDVSAIAGATGVGVRALQLGFRRHRDTTPMAYLRLTRLERAHHDLQAGDPTRGDTVREIAARWGFANTAHFATTYRRRYGRSPRLTLAN